MAGQQPAGQGWLMDRCPRLYQKSHSRTIFSNLTFNLTRHVRRYQHLLLSSCLSLGPSCNNLLMLAAAFPPIRQASPHSRWFVSTLYLLLVTSLDLSTTHWVK